MNVKYIKVCERGIYENKTTQKQKSPYKSQETITEKLFIYA